MKIFKQIIYFALVVATYCLASLMNYQIGKFILEIFTFSFRLKLVLFVIEVLTINPIMTFLITDHFSFKEKQPETKNTVFLDE